MNQLLYIGVIATCIVFFIAILSLFIALKKYRPDWKIMKFFPLGVVMIGIMGLASFQVLTDNHEAKVPYDPAVDLYKNADWVLTEDAGLSQLSIKHKWEETPTIENKFLFSLTLLKNNDINRAVKLLEEVKRSVEASEYLTVNMVEDALSIAEALPEEVNEQTGEIEESALEPIHDILAEIKESVEKNSKFDETELSFLATIDRERLIFLTSINGDTSEAREKLDTVLNTEDVTIRNPVIKKEIAKSSMFFQNNSAAEKYLIDVIQDYPSDHEAITMLSEIYLNGEYVPSEAAQTLPQYNFAKLGAVQSAIETYEKMQVEDVLKDEKDDSNNEEFAFDYSKQLSNELAFALVDSIEGQSDENPTIDVRMSRYYFNKGDNETAKAYIQEMLNHKDELGVFEQMVINTIQYNDEKSKDLTNTSSFTERRPYMEEMYQMKEDLYASFHTPTIYGDERTVSEESYEYFLTETIKEPTNERISIMNIEPNDDGEITLYLGAENMEDLSKGKLSITDNGKPIEDFTFERLSDLDDGNSLRSIGLVLDVSGSMDGSRIEMAKSAGASFLQQIKDYEQAELVSFNSAPTLVQSFTKDKGALVSSVMGLSAGGNTNITDSLIYELERLKNEDGHKVLFIFSDGEDDVFSQVESRAKVIDLANQYGISIFAVGFGAGYETLSEVAVETGGAYIATPNEATIFSGFDSVSEMLDNVYRVTYQLDPVEYGTHIVKAQYDQVSDKKEYELAAPAAGPGDDEEDEENVHFDIYQMIPSTIYQSKGDTVAILSGKGLKDVELLSINGEEIEDYKILSDEEIEITIPDSISYGLHLIVAVNNKGEEAQTEFVVSKPGMQDNYDFGWATLYADFCQAQGTTIECIGNPSVDKFLYPSGAKMTLKNDEELTFNGLAFDVQDSKLSFFKSTLGGRNEFINEQITMKKKDYGEFFDLSNGSFSGITFNKLGFDIALTNMGYQAKLEKAPGSFTAETKFNGSDAKSLIGKTTLTNLRLIEKISQLLDYSMEATAEISPDQANITGKINYSGFDAGLIGFSDVGGGFQYDDIRKRFVFDANVGGFEIANRKLKGVFEAADLSIGVEYPFKTRFGLTLEGNVPIGATGLTLNKAGLLVDATSYREGGFDVGVGTVADPVIQMAIQEINNFEIMNIKLFELDENTQLLGLDISGLLKNAFTSDWEGTGKATGQVIGFNVVEANSRYTKNLIESELKQNDKTFKTTIVFNDPAYWNDLVIYHESGIEKNLPFDLKVMAKANFEIVPSDLGRSDVKISGQVGWTKFEFDKDDLNIFN
ncbi:VWA domain-containing protein [Salirhabdus sp. Marseille-P4669]|uniref:VWA domain-containing protein n=1 Tax=Salirhabdus sp. Marseille-P4669 TaxID=2042310 RepID=UPI000C7A53EE|nr:VWA domain-containing protein [Salirhabdus sp. Marseille-P4669]